MWPPRSRTFSSAQPAGCCSRPRSSSGTTSSENTPSGCSRSAASGDFPDGHHVAPVYSTELSAFRDTPWADLFAFHYTLDRPAIRARYHESVLGSIVAFTVAVAVFWGSTRANETLVAPRSRSGQLAGALVAMVGAAAIATVALAIVVSVQGAFPAVATLGGADRTLVGVLLLVPLGLGLGVAYAAALEGATDPLTAAALGCAIGVGTGSVACTRPAKERSPPGHARL